MAKKTEKGRLAKTSGTALRFAYFSTKNLLRWMFVDSVKLVKQSYVHARYPEIKDKLDRNLELHKKVTLYEKKIKRLERLTYAIYKDPTYSNSDKGVDDIKELQRGLKDELH